MLDASTIKKGKRVECSGVELPSGDMMNKVDDEGYKYHYLYHVIFGLRLV